MKSITDQSYGVVPVIKVGNEWRVLLVHQISYRGANDRFWTFPKGHSEGNESSVETAKRELLEETGISEVLLIEDVKFSMSYSFVHKNQRINKTVTYFLGVCKSKKIEISAPEEIADIKWLTFEDASEKITHDKARKILTDAEHYLKNHELN